MVKGQGQTSSKGTTTHILTKLYQFLISSFHVFATDRQTYRHTWQKQHLLCQHDGTQVKIPHVHCCLN